MPHTNQYIIRYFDIITPLIALSISILGLLCIFSATYTYEKPFSLYFIKQTIGLATGICIYTFFCSIDYRTLLRWGYFSYLIVIALLLLTLLKGAICMGGQRWIGIGMFRMQPSELTKLLFPAFAIHYLIQQKDEYLSWYLTFLPVLVVLTLSFILIRQQPDLGTALIILATGLLLLWLAGLSKYFFIISGLAVCIGTPILWNYVLRPYQKNRILVFLGYGSPYKERYQIEQATIAIGSGGRWGKGLLHGTQNKFKFLPEARTDFIFAVLCEEWGFAGATVLLLLFFLLFIHIIRSILSLHDKTIQLFAFGTIAHIIISTIVNIGMVLGLLPIVGIPLPFVSYGLSNLWISCASLGWFSRIIMQQRYLEDYLPLSFH